MKLEIWLPIALTALGIIVTIAIFVFKSRKGARDRPRQLLDQFLNPLESLLQRTKNAFDALQIDQAIEVHRMEFTPSNLKHYFQQLPEMDLRRTFWMTDIERIHSLNQDAVKLIDLYAGDTLLRAPFKQACQDFADHVQIWKARWDYALASTPIVASTNEQSIASTFPESIERELPIEIDRISRLAGIKR